SANTNRLRRRAIESTCDDYWSADEQIRKFLRENVADLHLAEVDRDIAHRRMGDPLEIVGHDLARVVIEAQICGSSRAEARHAVQQKAVGRASHAEAEDAALAARFADFLEDFFLVSDVAVG